jgi:uncharacterized protein (DUF2236 family)
MAGVAQHSDFRARPLARLRGTAYYVGATCFGDRATAERAAETVRRIHRHVQGTDPVTGQPYSAEDPETALWVHTVEWHSFLAAYRAYGGGLDRADQDRYLAEGARIAALLGVPEADVPASVAATRAYFARMRPRLCVSEASRDAIDLVVDPPLTRELLPYQLPMRVVAQAALAIVPRHLRVLAGIDRPRALDALTVAPCAPPPRRSCCRCCAMPRRSCSARGSRARAERPGLSPSGSRGEPMSNYALRPSSATTSAAQPGASVQPEPPWP